MMRRNRGLTWAFVAFVGVLSTAPAMAQDANTVVAADTVVASVNGTEITLGHLAVMRGQLAPQYRELPDDVLFNGLLEQAIQQAALAQAAQVTRREELALENDRHAYLATLVLQDAVKTAVTDAAIEAAYDAKYKGAEPGLEYNAAHILVKTEEEAAALKAQLDDGADFAALAREHSTDGAAAGGGTLGWFGPGMMVKPFEDAVVAMKPGQIAGPVQTQFGWHLIHLAETRVASAPALGEVRDELGAEIEQATLQARVKQATDDATVIRPELDFDPAILKSATFWNE